MSIQKKNLFDSYKYFNILFYIAVSLFAALSIANIKASGLLVDTLEHLRASFFIGSGLLPYKDFFEHHNPLLWFMLSPLTKMLYGNLVIVPLVRSLALLGYFLCIYLIYLINAKFIYGKKAALISTFVLISLPIWFDIINIRPDIFMMLCFLGALYLFYSYLENKKLLKLIVCYTLISISFLFLQKVLFLIFGFGLVNLWYIYKKELKIKDVIIASVVASAPLIIFCSYLLYNGIFDDWFYYNFTFNTIVHSYYDYHSLVAWTTKALFFISFIIIFKQYANDKKALPIFVLVVCAFFSLLYFFPYIHYAVPYFLLASVYFGIFFEDIKIFSHKILSILSILVLFFGILSNYSSVYDRKLYADTMKTMEDVNNIEPDKTVFLVTNLQYSIFRKPLNYHWFGFNNSAIIDVLNTVDKYFDFNEFLKENKPDYIIYSSLDNELILSEYGILDHRSWFIKRNKMILKKMQKYPELRSRFISINENFWQIDKKWIELNYTQIKDTTIYKRNDLMK